MKNTTLSQNISSFGQYLANDNRANNDDPSLPILTLSHDRPESFAMPGHRHHRAELIYAAEGVMRVSTERATWVVPPQQAVWIPPGLEHSASHIGPVALRILYFHPLIAQSLLPSCCVINVSPLLREMILHATALGQQYEPDTPEARVMAVIPDLLSDIRPEPLQLPLPVDRRLTMITDALMENPADKQPLNHWANCVGASERTLSRRFRQETGVSFNEWRQRLRLICAITRLSEGASVTAVAYEMGYESPSAFIAMFRRELGVSPKRYLKLQAD